MSEQKVTPELIKNIGVFGLSSNLINVMIGAGIFVLPAIIATDLGSASILAYLFCGFLVGLVMLCFAEVGSKISDSGGAYAYIEEAFGPYWGFLASLLFVSSCIAADAAVANALVDLISLSVPLLRHTSLRLISICFIFIVLAYINIRGVKQGIRLVQWNTVLKLIPLLLIVVLGWTDVTMDNLVIDKTPSLDQIGRMSLLLFFAFQGAEAGLSVNEEVRNPKQTIPRSIAISITGVLILYVLLQTVAQGVLGSNLAFFKESPLSETAAIIFGPTGFVLITIGASISMFGYLSGEILSLPRVLYGAAKNKTIPFTFLAKIHPVYKTPYISIMIYSGLGLLMALAGGFEALAILSSASILLIYLGVVLSVVPLRKKFPDSNSFKIPFGYSIPILACIVIIGLLSNLSNKELLAIGGTIILLSFLYFQSQKTK